MSTTTTANNCAVGAIPINFNTNNGSSSSNYYKQQPSTPTSSSFTAMLAAAEAAVSSLNTEYEYEIKNGLNIINNIQNLTDDDDNDTNSDDLYAHHQNQQQQFHFNESFELDEGNILFNNGTTNYTVKSPLSTSKQQQDQRSGKCAFQNCFFANECKLKKNLFFWLYASISF